MKKVFLNGSTPLALLSLPFETVPLAWWVAFFLGALCAEVQGSLTTPPTESCVGREASSRQEGRPSSLTLTPVCLSCLLTPDMGWDNPGSGAKLVTSTYQIRAESCINPFLAKLCSVLGVFGFLYFFLVFHVLGPNALLLKLCFVTGEEGREEVWHSWGPRALSSKIQLTSLGLHTCLNLPMCGNYFSEWDGNEKGKKPQCLYAQSASHVLDPQSSVKTALWVLKRI